MRHLPTRNSIPVRSLSPVRPRPPSPPRRAAPTSSHASGAYPADSIAPRFDRHSLRPAHGPRIAGITRRIGHHGPCPHGFPVRRNRAAFVQEQVHGIIWTSPACHAPYVYAAACCGIPGRSLSLPPLHSMKSAAFCGMPDGLPSQPPTPCVKCVAFCGMSGRSLPPSHPAHQTHHPLSAAAGRGPGGGDSRGIPDSQLAHPSPAVPTPSRTGQSCSARHIIPLQELVRGVPAWYTVWAPRAPGVACAHLTLPSSR
jgi:hypothetical protein